MTSDRLVVSVPDPALLDAVASRQRDVEFIDWDMTTRAPRETIDIVVPPYMGTLDALTHLEHVRTRLVQGQSVGYDGVLELLAPDVVYANAAGVHEASTSELTLALVLASQRGLADFVRAASHASWEPAMHPSLADRCVLLVGYGGVGRAIEARLLPFETDVVRVAQRARSDERGAIYGVESLPELLPNADVVIVVVPLSAATTHLVNEEFLRLMADGALLVNVARGRVADTEAILKEARSARLRFALDVTDPEPLPRGHELFTLDNVIISPHVGGNTNAMLPRMARLLSEQIERMQNGQEPLNVIPRG